MVENSRSSTGPDRRTFLRQLGTVGAGLLAAPTLLPSPLRASSTRSPRDRLHIAAIGTGNRCRALLEEVVRQGENVVALCDVDATQAAKASRFVIERLKRAGRTAPPGIFDDYRKLLEAEKTFDAVLIATGSRWHAPLVTRFLQAGKHVFCEKPLVHKSAEARELAALAARSRMVTQTGSQGGASPAFRRAVEIVRAGVLGQVRTVHLWCDGYGRKPPSHDRPPGGDPVPAGLNWDFWLGPSPLRPFKEKIYHPGCLAFQQWFDFCNGTLAGQGAHTFFLPVQALQLAAPVRVTPRIPEPIRETYVSQACFRYEFPARGPLAPVTLWWTDGGRYPPPEVTARLESASGKVPNMGCLFVGEAGELYAGGWGAGGIMRMKGETRWRGVLDHEAAQPVPLTLPRAPDGNHMLEWLQACKGGPATFAPFAEGARVVESYLPAILSLRLGRPIEWDAANLRVIGAPEAEPLIRPTYRMKWLA